MPSLDNRQKGHVGNVLAENQKDTAEGRIKMCQTELNLQTGRDCEYAVVSGRVENYLDNFGPWQDYN